MFVRPYVHMSVRLSGFGGTATFSAPKWVRASLLMDVFILVLVAKLLYNHKCPYIRLSVCVSGFGGNSIFSVAN